MDSLDAIAQEAERIATACGKEFAGKPAFIQGAALLELHSTFLSGYQDAGLIAAMLEMHTRAVLAMALLKFETRKQSGNKAH